MYDVCFATVAWAADAIKIIVFSKNTKNVPKMYVPNWLLNPW